MKNLVVLCVLAVAFVSCNSKSSVEKLMSKDWEVIQIKDSKDFSKAPTITFNSEENTVNGNAGCNNYFGDFTASENKISFAKMGSTKMMCPEIATEELFLGVIEDITEFKFEGDNLLLLSADGSTVMTLK